jgi:hypothetical protein
MPRELLNYSRNVYSQNGEDGVLAEILRRLGIPGGWFCEFGAWDGRHLSNTYHLLEKGWSGVMIEGEPDRFAELLRTAALFPKKLYPIGRFISPTAGPDCLDRLLATTPIPKEFEVLSVDVDGPDYQIWQSLVEYRPTVVIIEVDSNYPPGMHHIHGAEASASSFTSMIELGATKGYTPVAHTGNIFFVRSDRVAEVVTQGAKVRSFEHLFSYTRKSAAGNARRLATYYLQRIRRRLDRRTPPPRPD